MTASDVTVVADAGMISAENMKAIEREDLSFILGERMPSIPYQIAKWVADHPDQTPADGLTLAQHQRAHAKTSFRRNRVTYYRYSAGRSAEPARDQRTDRKSREGRGRQDSGQAEPVRHSQGRGQERQSRVGDEGADAGRVEGLHHQHRAADSEFVIGAYHQLWRIEKSFRMSKGVFGGAADLPPDRGLDPCAFGDRDGSTRGGHVVEERPGWSIKKFVTTTRRYRTIEIRVGDQIITAADPLPDDLADVLSAIRGAH